MAEIQHAIRHQHVHPTAHGTGLRATIPAPVAGWNATDPEAEMAPLYALEMLNAFPEHGRVTSRGGCSVYADLRDAGDSGEVGTLAEHRFGPDSRFYAWTPTKLWDVSDPDSPTEVSGVSVTDSRWRTASIGSTLVAVNGQDAPIRVTGGAVQAHGFSGDNLVPTTLSQVITIHNRLFFGAKDSPKLWYGALGAVTGMLNAIDLGLVVGGGNIAALGVVTFDSGSGVDDYLAVFMTGGRVVLFAGTNPADAASWRTAGIFDIGSVVGDRPVVQRGGDLICITVDGYVPLLPFIHSGRSQQQAAISAKIAPEVVSAVREHGSRPGWQAIQHAPANWLLFNVPRGGGIYEQHISNIQTGAWARFTGLDAACWLERGNRLYFGSAGKVMLANDGPDDCGRPVPVRIRSAYNYLSSPYTKHVTLIRAHIESSGDAEGVSVGISADFERNVPALQPTALTAPGTAWNAGSWNTSRWASGILRSREWRPAGVRGTAISVQVGAHTSGDPISLFATDVLFTQDAGL